MVESAKLGVKAVGIDCALVVNRMSVRSRYGEARKAHLVASNA